MSYTPSKKVLERYADVLVNFALGGGAGIKRGDVVRISANEAAKPLYVELHHAVWKSGGHALGQYLPDDDDQGFNLSRDYFTFADSDQIDFFPAKYQRGLIDEIDHSVHVITDADMHALEGVDPALLMRNGKSLKPAIEWRTEKENAGRFTWTLGMWGTPAMAAEAGLSEEEYWQQIIDACFLDDPDPIARWREVSGQITDYVARLDALDATRLHVVGEDVDLIVSLGERRKWVGGSGRNIPSFEIFTSPDWRGTDGWIAFNQPLYRYGNLVSGIRLEFKDGLVVSATADRNEQVLKEMVATEGADKVGEFSLTDRRFSRITKFMAETLYDENVGGPFGNTHIALGKSYHDAFAGDPASVSEAEWDEYGFNNSTVHTDIVSTSDRTVTATLRDGSEVVIYADGQFQLD
ncbi:MAG TPA: aminopeptidase [Solirubrobacteraceae bacterium]|jgi:aminopeptidase|nr:aminopeptidase [Solirubrobacteraceae bacterium]